MKLVSKLMFARTVVPLWMTLATIAAAANGTELANKISTAIAPPQAQLVLAHPARIQQTQMLPAMAPEIIESIRNQPPKQTKGRLQIGVGRQLDRPFIVNSRAISANDWVVQPDGTRTWSISLTSVGSLGIRVHLEALNLPASGRLFLYDGAKPDLAPLITTYDDLAARHDLWMDTVFSDHVILTCQVVASDVSAVSFQIGEISHIFTLPKVGDYTKEGTCHNDVTCYKNWAQEAAGVARISFVENGNTYLCSGCVLAATGGGIYFLTAHHCVTGGNVASTVQFFWLYQTASCNGPAPDISTVPTTGGGGDLLAGSSTDDFSFMRMHRTPPAGVNGLSWSTDAPAAGQTLTCIHHPDGSYKRISFGRYYDQTPAFWAVQWYSGVTEGGSSGSPLFNANHQVIGQLNGGFGGPGSSCNNPSAPDQYGRFDVAFPSLQKWLTGGTTTPPPGTDFSAVKGIYNGLFSDNSSGDPQDTSGFVTLSVTSRGKVSGKLQIGAQKISMAGQFDENGNASANARSRNGGTFTVQLHVDISGSSDQITGTVTDGTFNASLSANRGLMFVGGSGAFTPGHYTMTIPGNPGSGSQPGGDSYATVTLDRAGNVKVTGVLGDGTKISQSTTVSPEGAWPFYVALYGGQGSIFGWLNFGDLSSSDLGGTLRWVRPSVGGARYYPDGFNISRSVSGSYYSRPMGGNNILNLSDGQVALTGGDLNPNLFGTFTMLPGSRVQGTGDAKLGLAFSLTTGLFTGRLIDPGSGQAAMFRGVVLQRQNIGAGMFLGPDQTGEARITQ